MWDFIFIITSKRRFYLKPSFLALFETNIISEQKNYGQELKLTRGKVVNKVNNNIL